MKISALLHLGQNRLRRTIDRVGEFATVIGPEAVFTGAFQGKDNYIVHGRVEGQCDLDGTLFLGERGRWEGDITAANVVIAGEVRGDVTAREKLELAASARIRGNIKSPVIAMAEGAAFDGKVDMAQAPQLTRFSEKREPQGNSD